MSDIIQFINSDHARQVNEVSNSLKVMKEKQEPRRIHPITSLLAYLGSIAVLSIIFI